MAAVSRPEKVVELPSAPTVSVAAAPESVAVPLPESEPRTTPVTEPSAVFWALVSRMLPALIVTSLVRGRKNPVPAFSPPAALPLMIVGPL